MPAGTRDCRLRTTEGRSSGRPSSSPTPALLARVTDCLTE